MQNKKRMKFRSGISDRIAQNIIYTSFIQALDGFQQGEVKKVALRLAMYYGDWSDALEEYVRLMIKDQETYNYITIVKDKTENVVKEAVDKISMLYNDQPQRTFVKPNKEPDDQAEEVYRLLKIDKLGVSVNTMYNLVNDVIVLVDWNHYTELPYFRKLNRANCGVKVNRYFPDMIEKLIIYNDTDSSTEAEEQLNDEYAKMGQYKIVWTPEEHYIELQDGKKVAVPGRSNENDFKNYYGIIPVVALHKEPVERLFWNTITNEELFDLMLHNGFRNSLDSFTYFWNSFKMLILFGEEQMAGAWPDLLNLSPNKAHKFPTVGGSGKAEVIDLMNDFEKLEEYKNKAKKKVYDVMGVQIEANAINQAQAGIALKIKNTQLAEVRKKQEPDFIDYEADLFNVIRVVWNYHNEGKRIDEETVINTFFTTSEVFVSRMDKLKYWWTMYTKGLKTGAEFYMTFNTTVTDTEEAEAKFLENLEKFKQLFGEPSFSQEAGEEDILNIEMDEDEY